jgi:hypothetical protein
LKCEKYADCAKYNAHCANTDDSGMVFECKCNEEKGFFETENPNPMTVDGITYTTKCMHFSGMNYTE